MKSSHQCWFGAVVLLASCFPGDAVLCAEEPATPLDLQQMLMDNDVAFHLALRGETESTSPGVEPQTTSSRFPRDAASQLMAPDAESPEEILADFQAVALWSVALLMLGVAGVAALKAYRTAQGLSPELAQLKRVALLQLRPDVQLVLIQAEDRRFLVTLDRQGARFLEPLELWPGTEARSTEPSPSVIPFPVPQAA